MFTLPPFSKRGKNLDRVTTILSGKKMQLVANLSFRRFPDIRTG
jgi:hypothetical protein